MERIYHSALSKHLQSHTTALFLQGAVDVGKTHIVKQLASPYQHHKVIDCSTVNNRKKGTAIYHAAVHGLTIDSVLKQRPAIVLNEIYTFEYWRNLLQNLCKQQNYLQTIVTGGHKLDVRTYHQPFMKLCHLYQIFPLSVAELLRTALPTSDITLPSKISDEAFQALFEFGGFPEPFSKQEKGFHQQWQTLHQQQMIWDHIERFTRIKEIKQLEALMNIFKQKLSPRFRYIKLSQQISIAHTTIRHWLKSLEAFYYCFLIKAWSKDIPYALMDELRLYLVDWSIIEDPQLKLGNFVATHLYKAVNFWNDFGYGEYELFFIRDKQKRELDFLVTKNKKPWILIDVESSGDVPLRSSLLHFQSRLQAPYVLQLALNLPYIEQDFRELKTPTIFPLKTFLSQLI